MRIAIGMDHRGATLRNQVIEHLKKTGHEVVDFGTDKQSSVDYPDYAAQAAHAVASKQADRGILICGTGIGMSIAANKVRGIRCAVCTDEYGSKMARSHNDANMLALRSVQMDPALNLKIIDTFLSTDFEGGRHQVRVNKIRNMECL